MIWAFGVCLWIDWCYVELYQKGDYLPLILINGMLAGLLGFIVWHSDEIFTRWVRGYERRARLRMGRIP